MANKATITAGSPNCNHKWVKRDKKNFSILERACTECGQVELHSECKELTEEQTKKLYNKGE